MSYSQEVYDAVRSRISGFNIAETFNSFLRQNFEVSHIVRIAQQEVNAVAYEWRRPSVVFRPTLSPDGDMWCALLGEDLVRGVAGFGETPEAAMAAFDQAFWKSRTPEVLRSQPAPAGEDGR